MILFAWHLIISRNMTLLSIKSLTNWLRFATAITSQSQILLLLRDLSSCLETRFLHWNANAGTMLNNPDGKLWKYLEYQKLLTMVSQRAKCWLFCQNYFFISLFCLYHYLKLFFHGLSQTIKAKRQFWNFPDERIRVRFVG